MGPPKRPSRKKSKLYTELAAQISANNAEEARRVYKELLRSGEPVGAIVGIAMASVHKEEYHRESRESESAINEPSGQQQISVGLRQSAAEVALQQVPSVELYIGRSERLKRSGCADGDDRRPDVFPALRRLPTEITQVASDAEAPEPTAVGGATGFDIAYQAFTADATSDAEAPEPTAVGGATGLDIAYEAFAADATSDAEVPEPTAVGGATGFDIAYEAFTADATSDADAPEPTDGLGIAYEAFTDTADDPRPISPTGVVQSPRPGPGLQLVMRYAMRRAQIEPTQVTSDADAPEPAAVDGAGDSDIHHEPITDTPHDPAGVAQSPSVNPGLEAAGRLATRSIIVLAAALAATVGISLPLREHRPADKDRAAALQPAVVSPPTLAFAAGAAGLSRAALSPTITVASAGFSEEKRPTVVMPGVAPADKAAVIAAVPAIIPAGAPVSPADVSALLRRGDALLATGDIVSARLFYEQAAMAGDATAALWLGESYDSRFLAVAGLHGLHSDPALAARWYRRARELGASEAEILLKSTEDRPD